MKRLAARDFEDLLQVGHCTNITLIHSILFVL